MNKFESELSLTFRMNYFHFHKRSIASSADIRFLKAEGYDYSVLSKGQYYGIEAKQCERCVTSIPFNRLADHQIEALIDCEREDGIGYIFINFRKLNKKNISFAIRIKDFIEIRDKSSKKSVSVKEIEYDPRFIKFIKTKIDGKLVWDLSNIIKGK
jgi:recombination protein U